MKSGVFSVGSRLAQGVDWWLLSGVCFLLVVGLAMHYSIGLNQEIPDLSQFYKQCIFAFIGLIIFFFFAVSDYRVLKTHPFLYVAVSCAALIAVLFFGSTIHGTTGWFVIAGVSVQPVELVKLMLILFMAAYLEKNIQSLQQTKYVLVTGVVTAILIALVILQPDLGSSLMLFAIWFSYLLLLRAPKWLIGLVIVLVVSASVFSWFFLFAPYQKDRLTTFLHPSTDPLGTGYNITQSIVAVGSGSLWGRGLGLGTQSQLHFLPEVGTDFIFAAIAEELGFFGALLVVAAFVLIILRLQQAMRRTKDPYAFLVLLGVASYITAQSILPIGMNIGIMPITGVPLPLVSAGGSSLVMTLTLLGLTNRMSASARSRNQA